MATEYRVTLGESESLPNSERYDMASALDTATSCERTVMAVEAAAALCGNGGLRQNWNTIGFRRPGTAMGKCD